jgi:hypothetical protein
MRIARFGGRLKLLVAAEAVDVGADSASEHFAAWPDLATR